MTVRERRDMESCLYTALGLAGTAVAVPLLGAVSGLLIGLLSSRPVMEEG
jgi:hypothetical protein